MEQKKALTLDELLKTIPSYGNANIEYKDIEENGVTTPTLNINAPEKIAISTNDASGSETATQPEIVLKTPVFSLHSSLLSNLTDFVVTKNGADLTSIYGRVDAVRGKGKISVSPRNSQTGEPIIDIEATNGDVKIKGSNIITEGVFKPQAVDFSETLGLPSFSSGGSGNIVIEVTNFTTDNDNRIVSGQLTEEQYNQLVANFPNVIISFADNSILYYAETKFEFEDQVHVFARNYVTYANEVYTATQELLKVKDDMSFTIDYISTPINSSVGSGSGTYVLELSGTSGTLTTEQYKAVVDNFPNVVIKYNNIFSLQAYRGMSGSYLFYMHTINSISGDNYNGSYATISIGIDGSYSFTTENYVFPSATRVETLEEAVNNLPEAKYVLELNTNNATSIENGQIIGAITTEQWEALNANYPNVSVHITLGGDEGIINTFFYQSGQYVTSTILDGGLFVLVIKENNYTLTATEINSGGKTIESIEDGDSYIYAGHTYTPININYTDGTNFAFSIKAKNGENGVGISSVTAGTSTVNGDYTETPLTFTKTDGTTTSVTVKAKNGADGASGGTSSGTSNGGITDWKKDGAIVATFNITSANTTITLQNLTGLTGIDWGDGIGDTNLSHTYTAVGKYTCKIYGVTAIGSLSFTQCTQLTSIVIPDSVTSIGENAFDSCSNLTTIEIGKNITTIGYFAFDGCNNLDKIIFGNTTPLSYSVKWFPTQVNTIIVPKEAVATYKERWVTQEGKITSETPATQEWVEAQGYGSGGSSSGGSVTLTKHHISMTSNLTVFVPTADDEIMCEATAHMWYERVDGRGGAYTSFDDFATAEMAEATASDYFPINITGYLEVNGNNGVTYINMYVPITNVQFSGGRLDVFFALPEVGNPTSQTRFDELFDSTVIYGFYDMVSTITL